MISAFLVLFIFVILPVIVVAFIIGAISKKNKTNRSEKEQFKDFENIIRSIYVYFLLICLLCAIIGGTIYLFSSTVDYILPEQPYSYNEDNYLESRRNSYIVGIFTASSILLSAIPLFVYHSKIAKSESLKNSINLNKEEE